ncbi:hypothetical protein HYR69_11190 [Candidatus Sumerlaeota bacterium]|nr:hypothetical protein [Candidatus Sumerlaeota bacterium]
MRRRSGNRERTLRKFVETHHARNLNAPLLFAAWYRTKDRKNVHLLEVANNVTDPGDASWMTFSFIPPPELELPWGGRLKITYLGPEEFHDGVRRPHTRGHKIVSGIKNHGYVRLFTAGNKASRDIERNLSRDRRKTTRES